MTETSLGRNPKRSDSSVVAAIALVLALVASGIWYQVLDRGSATRVRSMDAAVAVTHGGNPESGYHRILDYGCGACHQIPGVPGAVGTIGPSLANIPQQAMVAGVLANSADNLIQWIRVPQQVNPNTAMPDLGLDEQQARDIAAYLYSPRH